MIMGNWGFLGDINFVEPQSQNAKSQDMTAFVEDWRVHRTGSL